MGVLKMGDRGQILMKETGVYLYSHWGGSVLKKIVKASLKRNQRWNDVEYLTRIIFCEMIKDYVTSETGFGIGNSEHGDNEHDLIIVDTETQTVQIGKTKKTFKGFIK